MSKKRLCELDNYEKISIETKINKRCKIFTFKNNNLCKLLVVNKLKEFKEDINIEENYNLLNYKIMNIKIEENSIFICNYCNKSKNINYGIFVDNNKNLCKDCFM